MPGPFLRTYMRAAEKILNCNPFAEIGQRRRSCRRLSRICHRRAKPRSAISAGLGAGASTAASAYETACGRQRACWLAFLVTWPAHYSWRDVPHRMRERTFASNRTPLKMQPDQLAIRLLRRLDPRSSVGCMTTRAVDLDARDADPSAPGVSFW
jgi:hypothetical protein